MQLVSKTALAACSSGIALATVCGLLWLVPRWTQHVLDELPGKQAELVAVEQAYHAGRLEGVLLQQPSARVSDDQLRAGHHFDQALMHAAHAWPDAEREHTVSLLTASMRQIAQMEPGHLALTTLAAERDHQLEIWWRTSQVGVVDRAMMGLRPLLRVADFGVVGGLMGLLMSLWISALLMRHLQEAPVVIRVAPERSRPTPEPPPGPLHRAQVRPPDPREPDLDALAIVDLEPLLSEVVEALQPVAAHHGHELVLDVGDDLESFVVDPERLRSVLDELVEGPLRTSHPGRVLLRARREGRGVILSLVVRVRVEGFVVEGRRRGTVLVHDGVEALGGRLWWSAEPGDGVKAALWVPDRRVVDGRVVGSAIV
ncbi:MAG: hypothetical protein AAGA48_30770 [Myxococcota bacterium]